MIIFCDDESGIQTQRFKLDVVIIYVTYWETIISLLWFEGERKSVRLWEIIKGLVVTIQMIGEKYQFALCIDPETQKYYSVNLETRTIHLQQNSEQRSREEFADRAKEACDQLQEIISWRAFDYGVTKETEFYRRRSLPDYLLQAAKLKIPSYISEQPLQRSVTLDFVIDEKGERKQIEKLEIDAEIYLVEYVDVMRSKELFVNEPQRNIPKVFTCKLRLPNPVHEVIKVIIKMAFQKQQIELTTRKSDHQFVLKVFGSESYLYGNTTFVKYQYIRRCLRNKETARLQLTEKKFKDRTKFRGIVFERLKKDVDQGLFRELKWFSLRQQEPFLWYPPTKLDTEYTTQLKDQHELQNKYMEAKARNRDRPRDEASSKTAEIEKIREQLDQYIQKQREKHQMPHFILKQFMIKKTQERNSDAFNKILQMDNKLIHSGQCEFGFNIKALSILRFHNILNHKNNPTLSEKTSFKSLTIYFKFTYGNQVLEWKKFSPVFIQNNISLGHNIEWSKLSCLPFESKLIVDLIAFDQNRKEAVHVGSAAFSMFDEKGYLLTGTQRTNIWPFLKPDLRVSGAIGCYQKGFDLKKEDYSQIVLQFPKFLNKVRWSLRNSQVLYNFGYNKIDVSEHTEQTKVQERERLNKTLLPSHPMKMSQYSEQQKRILRTYYRNYSNNSEKYMNYMYSLNWTNPNHVKMAVNAGQMLNKEKEEVVKSSHYVGIFSSRFVDEAVRLNAVDKLISATDDEILLYLPQLVQALLSETVHQNALSELLLERATLSPYSIGQALFWQLKNQLHKQFQFQRFAVYFQCLILSSPLRKSFVSQLKYHKVFSDLSDRISFTSVKGITAKTDHLRTKQIKQLRIDFDNTFIIPVAPQKQNNDFIDLQCSVLTSKKKSYILTLSENPARNKKLTPGQHISYSPKIITLQKVIFRSGYDIRLDQLILQMMKIMDNIWLQKASLDLKMSIYKIITVSDMTGYIEVVGDFENWGNPLNSLEDNNQPSRYDEYLIKNNPKHEDYLRSLDNFVRSTAGFFVASYLLGLYNNFHGYDILTKNGIFVHIGYQNFLGSSQDTPTTQPSKSPFIHTPSMKYTLDKHNLWQQFAKLSADAYLQIRKNANFIIQMLMIMVSAGISHLYDQSNVYYLIDRLSLELDKQNADDKMRKHISSVFGVTIMSIFDIDQAKKAKALEETVVAPVSVPVIPENAP